MVTSQGSMPAAYTAAPISRSPLLPSSRMMATRGLSVEWGVRVGWGVMGGARSGKVHRQVVAAVAAAACLACTMKEGRCPKVWRAS